MHWTKWLPTKFYGAAVYSFKKLSKKWIVFMIFLWVKDNMCVIIIEALYQQGLYIHRDIQYSSSDIIYFVFTIWLDFLQSLINITSM